MKIKKFNFLFAKIFLDKKPNLRRRLSADSAVTENFSAAALHSPFI